MMRKRQASSASKTAISKSGDHNDKARRRMNGHILRGIVLAITVMPFVLLCYATSKTNKTDASSEMISRFMLKTPPKRFTKVPEGHQKTFFYDGKKITMPIVRSLRSRGWVRVNDEADAHLIYTYLYNGKRTKRLLPWQRFNHIPGYKAWNDKEAMIDGFKLYQDKTHSELFFLPEAYRLNVPTELEAFERRLERGGIDSPWVLKEPRVNQGRGITMLAPNSEQLLHVTDRIREVEESEDERRYIIQKYICNELTWNRRKFDVRMFWYIASLDPLVVFYHDGYVRIGNSEYNEHSFDNTRAHLTTHTGLGEEGKATFEQLKDHVTQHHKSNPELRHIRDPVQHIKSQFKQSLAELVAAFKDISFAPGAKLSSENGIGFYGADYVLDNDLDVWLIEPQNGCGLDEDYNFRLEMHRSLFDGVADIFEEVWRKQEEGKPLLPLENVGNWEIIYANGWQYTYEGYERSKDKKGCADTGAVGKAKNLRRKEIA